MSLLLLFAGAQGAVSITPINHGNVVAILAPDEIAVGVDFTFYTEILDEVGSKAQDEAPQISVWTFSSTGVRTAVVALAACTQVAASNLWSYTWVAPPQGTYEVVVAGLVSATAYATTRSLTVRPKFDPIGLAVDEVLVSRMGNDEILTS